MNTWIILRTIVHPATQHKPRSIAFVASVKCEVSKWRCIQNSVANNERRNKKEKRRGGEGTVRARGRGGGGGGGARVKHAKRTQNGERKRRRERKSFFLSFRQEVCLKVLKLSGCADCLCRVRNGGRTVARIVEKTRNMVYNRYPSIRDGIFLFLFAFHFARLPLQSFCRRRKRAPTCTTRYRDRMQGRNGLEIDQRFFSSRVCLRTFESA